MRRRIACVALVTALVAGMFPASAFAWCIGPSKNGQPGNGYGTHDWVLDEALKIAGADGAWVARTTALEASDDPDTYGTPTEYHLYKESGAMRGAPYMVANLYHRAVVAYRLGDRVAASKYLGTLSHYYSDVLVPFHSARAASDYRTIHDAYEDAVDDYQHKPGNVSYWITKRSYQPVVDVRARTVAAAAYSRTRYPELLSTFSRSRSVASGAPNRITREVLSRAANDLADIIRTIPTGGGEAPAPARVTLSLSHTFPAQYMPIGAFASVTDENGSPLEGVGVLMQYALPWGRVSTMAYSDASGVARAYQNVGANPILTKTMVTSLVPVNGTTSLARRWFMTTPNLATGYTGFSISMANRYPRVTDEAVALVSVNDDRGLPVEGLTVNFQWTMNDATLGNRLVTDSALTGPDGIARSTQSLGGVKAKASSSVLALTSSGGHNRATGMTFIPQP